ncbi:alginate export family protein [Methylocystis echinoides]|uniref:alginate export family protein n=1 Tax=Methylocystis echinoides TaxID=29468 RepID=UPI0034304318
MTSRNSNHWKATVAWGALLASLTTTPVAAIAEDNPASPVATKTESAAGKGKQSDATGGEAKADQNGVAAKGDAAKGAAAKPGDAKPEEKKSYYVPTRGYRLEPQPDIPPYVRNLGKTYPQFEGIDWLNVGLDSRVRFEYRQNDYRPWTDTTTFPPTSQRRYFPNSLWLSRTRVYLGIQNILDPFRAVVEFQDSRAFNSIYQLQGQEINQTDLISAYGELYFKDAFGKDPRGNDRPLTVRAGRFHFELLDRRLIAENEFRNTTNNFEGFRVKVGKKDNDWDLDSFFMRPVVRLPYQFDRPDWQNWVYGSVFSFRRFSEYVTVQPYFLGRTQYGDPSNPSNALKTHRETYAPGVRMYGVIGNFDYDFDINKQFGSFGRLQTAAPYLGTNTSIQITPTFINQVTSQNSVEVTVPHNALAWGLELGYTFSEHPWKPRISTVYVYGSGNGSPFNYSNSNFDIFYGFNQPFSRNDYFAWNNIKDPKVRLEFTPAKNLQIDTAFSAYWLASPANAWDRANLFAPLGNRGNFLGTEFDIRARYKLSQFINITASYARFWPGSFTSSFAPPVAFQQWPAPYSNAAFGVTQTGTTWGLTSKPTDFFYLEATANAFGDGQPITKDPVTQLWGAVGPGGKPLAPSWRDVYVGLNGGGAWSNPTTRTLTGATSQAVASNPVAAASRLMDGDNQLAGFIGGLQLGANWRFDPGVVAGVEADLHGVSGNTDTTMQGSVIAVGRPTYVNYGQRTATLNYLGTIRGRLGFLPTPTLQLYGTGGLAYGGVISNTALFTAPNGNPAVSNWTLSSAQFTDSLLGWTAGGGVEWMFMPNWSVKAEYLYYNLGDATATGYNALRYSGANIGLPNVAYNYGLTTRTKFDGNLVQAGINRHFDLFAEQ